MRPSPKACTGALCALTTANETRLQNLRVKQLHDYKFKITAGVRQGGFLLPTLFAVFQLSYM